MARSDTVGKGAGKSVCQRGGRQKQTDPETKLVAAVEKRQQIGYTRAEARLEDAHQEPEGHHALPVLGGRLARCDQTPTQHALVFSIREIDLESYQEKTTKAAHWCGLMIFHMSAWNSNTVYEM